MNISNSASTFTNQASFSSRPSGGQRPQQKAPDLAKALAAIGVDESKASNVLSQVEEAVASVNASSSPQSSNQDAIRSAVDGVLEANGIDPAKVAEQVHSNRPAGRPQHGPPPGGPKPSSSDSSEEDDTSSVESALLASNVDESNLDQLLSQMIEAINQLTSDDSTQTSQESVRSALTQILEDNGVDVARFESALGEQLGSSGSFFDRFA